MSAADDAVAQAEQALAAAKAQQAAEQAAAAANPPDSQAASQAHKDLGNSIGPFVADLIRRVEALEAAAFGHRDSSPDSEQAHEAAAEAPTEEEASA